MANKSRREKSEINKNGSEIKIDYKNLDVSDIMAQIKQKIAKEKEEIESSGKDLMISEPASPAQFPEPPENQGFKGKVKKILLKIMRPFSPVIKLLILPVHEEYLETARNLHWAHMRLDQLDIRLDAAFKNLGKQSDALNNVNVRIDNLSDEINRNLSKIAKMGEELEEITKSVTLINKRIDKVSTNTNKRIDRVSQTVNKRIDEVSGSVNDRLSVLYQNLGRAAEYIKLLHNLSHNLVIEMTKLKIEEEHLKLKTRIMEKDFEFVSRKEKALEEKIFQ
jgi:septal ring factor EnvC (AmiA/AmiB activator)